MTQAQLFAQATSVPNNGASNAEDFQPPTGNPQNNPVGIQEQSSGIQNPTSSQVLSDPNLRITVPNNPIDHKSTSQPQTGGINWLLVAVAAVVIVVAAELLIRRREKRTFAVNSTPTPLTVTEPEEIVRPETTEEPELKEDKEDKKPAKKKSKSKKKNK